MVVATITRWLTAPSAAAEGLDSSAITQPTLVLGAAADVLAPVAVTRAVADAIAGARYELLAGAGHMMNLEAPDALQRAAARLPCQSCIPTRRATTIQRDGEPLQELAQATPFAVA